MKTPHKRKDSPHHHVSVMVGDKRVRKSTGIADKATATKVAAAVKELADGILSPSQERLKRLCGAVFDAAGVVPFWENEPDTNKTFPKWREEWIKTPSGLNQESLAKYLSALSSFQIFIGNKPLRSIKVQDIKAWADKLAETNSPATVKQKVGLLASALDDAVADRILASNPARKVKLDGGATVERKALTDEEIVNLLIRMRSDNDPYMFEWATAIQLARWNGLRLMDAVNITEKNVNGDVLDFVCRKTGERMVVPVHPKVTHAIQSLGFCNRLRLKSKSQLSQTFTRMLEKAGIENPITVSASGKNLREKGFHSLRHSFITDLERKGVPEDVRMKLSGHKSKRIHAGYSHTDPIEEARKLIVW